MSRLRRRKIKMHTGTAIRTRRRRLRLRWDRTNPQYTSLPPEQLNKLVAPIALYPDALVAQILAASAYPTQIVEANRMAQENPGLKGRDLAEEVDRQDWDPSVKSLVEFPTVLANLDKNLSWTSELGEAYQNQSDDVMQAVQYMRHKAYDAGNLRTTPQERVYEQGPDVDIQPADPDVVYVPTYNPAYVYGYPVGLWPGFYPWWGVGFGGPSISFGIGFPIAPFFGFGWGWHGWGIGWGFHGGVFFGGHPWAFRGGGFYNHAAFVHGNYRGFSSARGGFGARGFAGRGYGSTAVADLPAMDMAVTDTPVTDMRAHLAATRGRRTASPAAIAEQPLTGALQATEPTQATGDSPAANEVSLDADQAHRGLVVSAAAEAVRRADSLRMEAPAVRTVAGTLVADMPAVDTAAAVEVTVAADTAAGANCSA